MIVKMMILELITIAAIVAAPAAIIIMIVKRKDELKRQRDEQRYFDSVYADLERHLAKDLEDRED